MLRPRKTGWIGFDLGATSVKAAQAVRKNDQYFIRSAALVPRAERWTPEALAENPPRSSVDEMRAAASVCGRLSGSVAGAVLPMTLCEVAHVEVAAGQRWGRADLVSAAEAETQQSFAESVVEWWPARLRAERLNVIAAPRSWSERVSADVAAAGRHCRLIDALPWGLARAVSMVQPSDAPTAVALDLGYGAATMCLIHERSPALVRRLKDCGYGGFVAAVQNELRVDERDAEALLRKYGLSCPGAPAVCGAAMEHALAQALDRLEREIKRTLVYWHGQARGVTAETMYLFGGGASLGGLDARLTRTANLEVKVWGLPPENPADADYLPPAHLLGPALGLSAGAWES